VAIWTLPTTFSEITNRVGITTIARTARIAAGTDQTGSHPVDPGLGVQGRFKRDTESALAPLATDDECIRGFDAFP
jgi:hypothetical protein